MRNEDKKNEPEVLEIVTYKVNEKREVLECIYRFFKTVENGIAINKNEYEEHVIETESDKPKTK